MKRMTHFLIAALATAFCGSALASDIYRWTDENGNVHYGDRPTGAETEQRVAIASRRTDNAAVQAAYNTRYGEPKNGSAASEEEDKPMTRAERRAKAEERAATCQRYRDRLETLVTSRRLYREDENGERVYLDDAESQDARTKAEELVEQYCD